MVTQIYDSETTVLDAAKHRKRNQIRKEENLSNKKFINFANSCPNRVSLFTATKVTSVISVKDNISNLESSNN
jgi:hypothetical protein